MQKRNRALGIRSLSILNKAFLGKWYWRFFTKRIPFGIGDLFICKAMCAYVSPRVVKFEANGGTWISITERSRGFVVSVGFGKEELEWLSEHLKKVVELEAFKGFIQKIRGKTRTHLMEICYNNRGLKETIEDFRVRAFRGCHPMQIWLQRKDLGRSSIAVQDWVHVGKAIVGMMGTKGMVSITPISAYKGCFFVDSARRAKWKVYFSEEMVAKRKYGCIWKIQRGWLELKVFLFILGRVTKVARDSLKLVDLLKVKLWVEMLPNVVLPALLEVEDGAWSFTVAISVIGEDEEDDLFRSESTHSRDELMPVGGCVSQRPKNAEGLCGSTRDNECYRRRPFPRSRYRLLGPAEGNNNGPTKHEALFKARSVRAHWAKSLGPPIGPILFTPMRTSAIVLNARSQNLRKEVPLFVRSQGLVEARADGDEAFSDEDGWAFERKAQSLPNPSPLSRRNSGL
ncbi:hypothetical protein AAG906_014916 [Vitis piasezkii]